MNNMKILLKLLKVDLLNSIALNQYRNTKKHKARSKTPLVSAIFTIIFMLIIFGFYSTYFSIVAHEANNDSAIIIIGVGLAGVVTLLMTFGKAHAVLFKSKDFEFLSSLPISTNVIVASKILSLILINYLFFTLPYLPSFICYLIFTGFSAYKLIVGIIILLFGPFFITVVCTVFSYIIGNLFAKSKYKNALSTITSILIMILILLGTFVFEHEIMQEQTDEQYAIAMTNMLVNFFSKGYFLSNFALNAISEKLIFLLYYVLIALIPFIIFVYVISKNYVKINSRNAMTYKNNNFKLEEKLKKEKEPSIIKSLLKKEAKTFFGTTIYVTNVITGPIMSIIMVVGMYFLFANENSQFFNASNHIFITSIITLLSMYVMCMMPSTSCSISMEGKNFWILKTAPIKTEYIFIAKCLFYVLLCLPFILVNGIVGLLLWKVNIIDFLFIIVTQTIIVSASSVLSLWVNTCKYRFDWTNPAQVVKQSTDTLLSMLLSLVLDIVLSVPTFILSYLNFYAPIVTLFESIIILVLLCLLLFFNGKKRYENIEM